MLKLERRNRNIHITLQAPEPLWSRPFLIAFCAALSLHLFAFLLIHVRPIITHAKEIFLTPVIVNARIEVQTNLESPPAQNPFMPLMSEPTLPNLSTNLPFINCRAFSHPFPSVLILDLGFQEKPLPLTITVSGPLSNIPMFQDNPPKPERRLREQCTVKVDNYTGKVFWNDSQNPIIEPILDSLFFATESIDLFTTGIIEVSYD